MNGDGMAVLKESNVNQLNKKTGLSILEWILFPSGHETVKRSGELIWLIILQHLFKYNSKI